MPSFMPLTLAVQSKDVGNLSSVRESPERAALNALFALLEKAEPTLLMCRDALAASPGYTAELKAIHSTLARIGEVKSTCLRFPGRP
jgi:hypothetical protein